MKIAHLLFSGILMLLLPLFMGPNVTFSSVTTDESDTRIVGSLPGKAQAVAVEGDYASPAFEQ